MKIKEGKISIFIGQEYTTIELYDSISVTRFAEVRLTPTQLSMALSRLAYTPCEIEVHGLERLGKKHELKSFEFEIPKMTYEEKRDGRAVHEIAIKAAPEGWTPDNYFGSQTSFFERDGKQYARGTIRRWVNSDTTDAECDTTKLNQGTER